MLNLDPGSRGLIHQVRDRIAAIRQARDQGYCMTVIGRAVHEDIVSAGFPVKSERTVYEYVKQLLREDGESKGRTSPSPSHRAGASRPNPSAVAEPETGGGETVVPVEPTEGALDSRLARIKPPKPLAEKTGRTLGGSRQFVSNVISENAK